MEYFESITEALREIKNKTQNFTKMYENIYLFIDCWQENFYVTVNEYDINTKIKQIYYENGCEPEPEEFAKKCVVIEYTLATNKEAYPMLYEKSVKPKFTSKVELIRQKLSVKPEYSLEFNINQLF